MKKPSYAPINWYGGKGNYIHKLLFLVPPHRKYVEVFGGSGVLLFNKKPAVVDIYNDIYSDLVNFFKLLRDNTDELMKKLTLTPYSREEWHKCKRFLDNTTFKDDAELSERLERARCFFVMSQQSFGSATGTTIGFASSGGYERSHAIKFLNKVDRLPFFVSRLRQVVIENMDFEELMLKHDSSETFFYLDPPYPKELRLKQKMYRHETSEDLHKRMLDIAVKCKGKVLISGYEGSKLYEEALKEWNVVKWDARLKYAKGRWYKQQEVLWYNYPLTFFNNISGGGNGKNTFI